MMKLEDFSKVLELHGTDSANWPADLRKDLESFLSSNKSASALYVEHRQLEQSLDEIAVPEFPNLQQKVLKQALPPRRQSLFDQLLVWIFPGENFGANLWRPVTAASLPLVFGIVLGNYYSFGINTELDEYDYWEDELAMLALTDYSESEF